MLNAQTAAQAIHLTFDPAKTRAEISLPATLHTVHGTFALKHGQVDFDPATGQASGEVVFDATSGRTGVEGRDHKMHKHVLESQRYPDIVFRPDHADGRLVAAGSSTFNVHGIFLIHGSHHELTLPVHVIFDRNTWSAKASFQVPYVQWGLENPSTFFLKVPDHVQVQVEAAGSLAAITR